MNAFAGVDVFLPTEFQDRFHEYCLTRTGGSKPNPENSPFPRMVDMWFLAVGIAVKEGLKPKLETKGGNTYKAIEGNVFGSDRWRSNALMLLALAYEGEIGIAKKPNEMMRIANGYALAGLPRLIDILESRRGDTALDHLCDHVCELLADK